MVWFGSGDQCCRCLLGLEGDRWVPLHHRDDDRPFDQNLDLLGQIRWVG